MKEGRNRTLPQQVRKIREANQVFQERMNMVLTMKKRGKR